MSHIEEGKTSLVFHTLLPLLQAAQSVETQAPIRLLQQALLLVAKEYGGEIRPYYLTYSGREIPANSGLALHLPVQQDRPQAEALPRGMGLVLDTQSGALTFRADLWGVDASFAQTVQQRIIQRYTALAHVAVLRQMHYSVSTQVQEDRIYINGERSHAAI
jgi:hypothetical protein